MKCIACKSEILDGASVCYVCKHFQRSWRNQLIYLATLSGFLVLISSLLLYMITTFPKARKLICPKNSVEVLAYNHAKQIVLRNSGDGQVFITCVFGV